MSHEAQHDGTAEASPGRASSATRDFLWSLPQPLAVIGAMLLVATAISTGWTDPDRLTTIVLLSPLPLVLLAERLAPKRQDWVLDWRELAEDAFWVLGVYLVWTPIYADYYETPISEAFVWLRDASAFPFRLEAETTLGLMLMAMIGIMLSEFIYYWLHRLQHRVMFFWRMHATHHHVTKMGAARSDRTHPLEFLALTLGPAIVLAFLGASDDVVAVALAFRLTSAYLNHANLPLVSGAWGWLFTTAQWHQLHHSCDMAESNRNYGCSVILWDRLFGTFSDSTELERVGNGRGVPLSIYTQLTMPFRSDETLRGL
ncbi:MAG TPA: sterol desaturase family protein [Pseudomonadales bacterium]|nr:sterol desaturase family protein [Pseudomonadales bacterium]